MVLDCGRRVSGRLEMTAVWGWKSHSPGNIDAVGSPIGKPSTSPFTHPLSYEKLSMNGY